MGLSLSDSSMSAAAIWRNIQILPTASCKPLPAPYPRQRNDALDNSIRSQMDEFVQSSQNESSTDSENASIITPYQYQSNLNQDKVSKTNMLRVNVAYNPYSHYIGTKKHSKSSSHSRDIKINRSSKDSHSTLNPSYSLSPSQKSTDYDHSNDSMDDHDKESKKKYIDLKDITVSTYKQYKNDNDFYKNRDNVIKQYVECGDKKKGTQNIIDLYLQRWHEEEMENIPKIQCCFNDICDEIKCDEIQQKHSKHRNQQREKDTNSNKARKSKKKKKKNMKRRKSKNNEIENIK